MAAKISKKENINNGLGTASLKDKDELIKIIFPKLERGKEEAMVLAASFCLVWHEEINKKCA